MIAVVSRGVYEIVETKYRTKILYLREHAYAWIKPKKIGEILVSSHRLKASDTKLSSGKYVLYDVVDEDYLTDLQHLELEYGQGAWQGYLLPTGLPNDKKIRSRIIATNELITDMPYFKRHIISSQPNILVNAIKGHA